MGGIGFRLGSVSGAGECIMAMKNTSTSVRVRVRVCVCVFVLETERERETPAFPLHHLTQCVSNCGAGREQ